MDEAKTVDQLLAESQSRIAALEDQSAVLQVERDNYKVVALKRKGKLENDENFFADHDEKDVEQQVSDAAKRVQQEREATRALEIERARATKLETDLAELKKAIDNKPAGSLGAGGSGDGQEVKDNVFSEAQETTLKQRWTSRGYSEEQQKRMLETEKRNALARRAL